MTAEEVSELVSSLYETWYASVVRYAARRLGNTQAAEDIVQDTFLQLYRELIAGRSVDNPRAWTFCVVRRQVLHQLGVTRRECDQHDSLDVLDRLPPNWTNPEVFDRDPADLRELLATLTKREEEVIHLRLAAMKYREIAAVLQISESSVNTMLIRALKKMKQASAVAHEAPRPDQVPMKTPSSHCTEELLLAHLDGELSNAAAVPVQEHLDRCWECRAKRSDLEARAHQLANLLASSGFLGPDRVTAARDRFLADVRQLRMRSAPSAKESLLFAPVPAKGWPWRLLAWPLAATIVLLFSVVVVSSSAKVDSRQAVAAAVAEEDLILQGPIHQELRLQLVQSSPPLEQQTQLQIWSDQQSHRYSAKWSGTSGRHRHAVWQPDGRQRFQYDQVADHVVPVSQSASRSSESLTNVVDGSTDIAIVQRRIDSWLTTRAWQPLSLAKDFSLFIDTEGVLLQAELRGQGADETLVLAATSPRGGGKLVVRLELDRRTHRVRRQEVRYQSAQNSITLRVDANQIETLRLTPASARLFFPDLPSTPVSPGKPPALARPALPHSLPPTAAELLNQQLELAYQLHRIDACVNDAVTINLNQAGVTEVSGIVDTPERKAEILSALGHVHSRLPVLLSIRTLDEVAASRSESPFSLPVSTNLLQPNRSAPKRIAVESLPLDQYLVDYFSGHPLPPMIETSMGRAVGMNGKVPETPKAKTAAYSTVLVSLSQRSHREAWAIQRLGTRFGNAELLSRDNRLLLEAMFRDHAERLAQAVHQIDECLLTVSTGASNARSVAQQPTAPVDTESEGWPRQATVVFQKADALNKRLFQLFAAGLPPDENDESADVRQVVSNLVTQAGTLERVIARGKPFDLDRTEKNAAADRLGSQQEK